MHHKTDAELAALYQPVLRSHGIEVSDAVAGKAAGIMKERATFTTDLWDLTSFFFEAPREYEEKQVRKYWKGQNPAILRELRDVLAGIDDFSLENTERIVHAWIEEKGYGMGQVMNTLRLALVGAGKGPGHVRRNVVHRQRGVSEAYRQSADQSKTRNRVKSPFEKGDSEGFST